MKNRDDATAFFGKVTASTTHELQNVLAIIKENAGLMEDFIQVGPENLPDLLDRITRCLGKIKEQAYRGVDLTSGLNQFAHTTDRLYASVNIYQIAKRLIFLTKRVFIQQGKQVVLMDCENSPSIETDPVLFQNLLWNCLKCLSETCELETNIVVRIFNSDIGKGIDLCYDGGTLDTELFHGKLLETKWDEIQGIGKELNLTTMTQTPPGIRILLPPPSP